MDSVVGTGAGYRTGRRPKKFSIPKREFMELVERLHLHGIGSRQIARLIGYSSRRVNEIQKALGLSPLPKKVPRDTILLHLTDDLRADVERVFTKSVVSYQRASNRDSESPARYAHELVDIEPTSCVNGPQRGVYVRPAKT
jgi:hypothetical protein